MTLIRTNHIYRLLTMGMFFNRFGASFYNIVFVTFAAEMSSPKLAVGLANMITFVPVVFSIWVGIKADESRDKESLLVKYGYIQCFIFLLVSIMIKTKAWLLFLIICVLNIISDVISDYRSGLEMPILQQNVVEEQLTEAFSFIQFTNYICMIFGQGLAVLLLKVEWIGYSVLAIINAFCFLLSSLALKRMDKYPNQAVSFHHEKSTPFLRNVGKTYKSLEKAFRDQENISFILFITVILIINMLGSGLGAIYNLTFLDQPLGNTTFSQSLFILQCVMLVSSLLGSVWSKDFFSELTLTKILVIDSFLVLLISLCNILQLSQYVVLLILGALFYINAKVMPKLNAILLKSLPTEILAQASNMLSVLFTLSLPLGGALFTFISINHLFLSWLLFSILSFVALLIAIYLVFIASRAKQELT